MHAKDSAAEPLLGDRRGSNAGQGAVSGVQKWPSGRRLLTVATTPRAMPAVAQQQAREPAPARSRVSPDRLRATHRDWKLSERHHRHKLTLAYLGESEMSGPPFSVCYVQLSRRELTIDVLFSSYPAGREALYADANGVPLPESQVPSMSPCSSSVPQPSPSTQTPGPSAPHFGGQQAHGLQAQMSRLPSGLLFSRRVEQLVGGFIRTRDVRMIDPTFSRELAELGMVGGAGLGAAQQSSPAQSLILVRCGAIIIRLFHLRAIVVHDGLYIVFDPRAAGSADADAVRAVALRLKASTQEDRLGGPDNEIASRRELDARDAHARDAMSTSRSELSLLARLDGDSVASGPPAPARAESCVSANESDIDMAALLHAAGPGPVLVGCSHIGAGEGRAHAHAPPDDEPAAAAPPQYTHGRQGRAAIGADEVQAHAGRPYAAASVRAVPAAAALSGARAVLEQGGSAGAAPGAAPGAAVPPRFTPRAADVAAADEGPSADLPPFPLRALEAIFDVVVDDLKSRLAALKDETRGALHALRLAVADPFGGLDDSVSFEVVRSLRERVRALTVSVRGAARAVAEVLDDDVQMAFIYLKKVHFAPELYEQVRSRASGAAARAARAACAARRRRRPSVSAALARLLVACRAWRAQCVAGPKLPLAARGGGAALRVLLERALVAAGRARDRRVLDRLLRALRRAASLVAAQRVAPA